MGVLAGGASGARHCILKASLKTTKSTKAQWRSEVVVSCCEEVVQCCDNVLCCEEKAVQLCAMKAGGLQLELTGPTGVSNLTVGRCPPARSLTQLSKILTFNIAFIAS